MININVRLGKPQKKPLFVFFNFYPFFCPLSGGGGGGAKGQSDCPLKKERFLRPPFANTYNV